MRALSVIAALCLIACGPGPTPPSVDAGSLDCVRDQDCQDDLFCNGSERCSLDDPSADGRGCVAATRAPCPASTECSEVDDACLAQCEADADADGDGVNAMACGGPDCDDADPSRFPGNPEVCDDAGLDEDCDPDTVGDRDADDDGSIDDACCNGDTCGDDCDDTLANVSGLAPEVCDTFDNDCDGAIDESVLIRSWPDVDDDRYGDAAATPVDGCSLPTGRADRGGDCDETDPAINPDAIDACDGVDDDCDGVVDDGAAAVCESTRPGASVECLAGACVVVGCTGSRFDCNGSDADGCERDVCSDALACDGCGIRCAQPPKAIPPSCTAGVCDWADITNAFPGALRDAVTGAPIAGATLTFIDSCTGGSATTDAAGEFMLVGAGRYVRIQAAGYPTHVQLARSVDLLIPSSLLAAWVADPDLGLTPSPDRAILVTDFSGGSGLVENGIYGPVLRANGTDLVLDSGGARRVYFDVVPGRMEIGGSVTFDAGLCTTDCGPRRQLLLEAGAITIMGDLECNTFCA